MRRVVGISIAALLVTVVACGRIQIGQDRRSDMDAALRSSLQSKAPAYVLHDPEGAKLWKLTKAFYEKREFAPAWIENAKPLPQMEALIRALREADREGLNPAIYNVAMLEQRRAEAAKGFLSSKGFDPVEAGALDVWLTYLYMKYASDLADGLSDLAHADTAWNISVEKFDPREHLEDALSKNRIRESLVELAPKAPEYERLRKVLAQYREQKDKGGWPQVPPVTLKPGQRSSAVGTLAQRLQSSGDLNGNAGAGSTYGPELVEAVKRFQRRHGLTDDGAVGKEVIAAMNVPIDARIRQIELNMERWRWLPRDLGERYILVNIPEMQLDIYDGTRVPLSMRVVVGKKDTQTPIFNEEMSYLVFSPYWNVPDSIAEGETLPSVVNDPAFLERNNMEVLDKAGNVVDAASIDLSDPKAYRFRQRPGGNNSLGLVKFMFPNQYNVYLHDTPADGLFGRASRSFSHGCVRVEDPVALASYVLRDQPDWTRERIETAMHSGEEQTVKLKDRLPVYLGYWTARVRPDNTVQFRKDVYDIDARQTRLVANRLERLRKSGEAAVVATTVKAKAKDQGKSSRGN